MASSATTWVKFATGAILSITVSWLVTACDATPTEKNVSVAQEADQQSPPHETKSKEQPPNIIYILADDLGYGDLGVYGQTKIQTPNLDRMAANGVLFTQHNSGSTVCAPSRSALMTGQHTGNTQIRGNAGGRKGEAYLVAGTDEVDGVSFLPTLQGAAEQQQAHESLYWEFHSKAGGGPAQAVRMGNWKGIRFMKGAEYADYTDVPFALYDL